MEKALAIVNQQESIPDFQDCLFLFNEPVRATCVFPGTGNYDEAEELCRACYRNHGEMLAFGEDFVDHPDYYVAAKLGGQIIATIGVFVKKTGFLPLEKQYYAQELCISAGDIELGRFSFHSLLRRYTKYEAARELLSALAVSHLAGRHGRFFLEANNGIIAFIHFSLGINGLFYKHRNILINEQATPKSKRKYYSANDPGKKPYVWEVNTNLTKALYRL